MKLPVLMLAISLVSCAGEQKQPEQKPAHGITQSGTTGAVAGVTWRVPDGWTTGPEKQMRVATYLSPASSGAAEGGECAVFYFGPGEGGDVEPNIDRWVGQFEQDRDPARTSKTVDGMNVHLLDLAGTYLASAGPMMGPKERKEGYRLLGAIVSGPQGSVFFKMTGPTSSVTDAEGAFHAMVESLSTL